MNQLATLRLEDRSGVPVACVEGEIDMSNAAAIHDALATGVPNTALGLVVELSEVAYLDSAGVRLVFRLAEELATRQQQLRLALPADSPVRRVLELSNVPAVAALHADAGEAASAIRAEGSS